MFIKIVNNTYKYNLLHYNNVSDCDIELLFSFFPLKLNKINQEYRFQCIDIKNYILLLIRVLLMLQIVNFVTVITIKNECYLKNKNSSKLI